MSSLTLVIAAIFIMVVQISSVIWLIVSAHRLTELAESHLKKSIFVENNLKALGSFGIFGKIPRNGSIVLMFLAPDFFERRGMIDAHELSMMPTGLKTKLMMPWIVSTIFSFAFFSFPYW
jgi:hypothetical protein